GHYGRRPDKCRGNTVNILGSRQVTIHIGAISLRIFRHFVLGGAFTCSDFVTGQAGETKGGENRTGNRRIPAELSNMLRHIRKKGRQYSAAPWSYVSPYRITVTGVTILAP